MSSSKSRIVVAAACAGLSFMMEVSVLSRMVIAQQSPQINFPPVAEGCQALKEVTTQQTTIRKTIKRGDENTGFAVPTGQDFQSFTVQMIPENTANYELAVDFKYSDGSTEKELLATPEIRFSLSALS